MTKKNRAKNEKDSTPFPTTREPHTHVVVPGYACKHYCDTKQIVVTAKIQEVGVYNTMCCVMYLTPTQHVLCDILTTYTLCNV